MLHANCSLGWAVPFIWAAIWAAITVPWVRSVMYKERTTWEEESNIMISTMDKPPALPTSVVDSNAAIKEEVNRESSTSGETDVERGRQGDHVPEATTV